MNTGRNKEEALWKMLVRDGLTYEGDNNATLPFGEMSKKYGKAWIMYLQAAWDARDGLTDEEFCALNGRIPLSFLNRLRQNS